MDLALGGPGDRGDDLHQRRLARAVGSQQPDDASTELEGEIGDGGNPAAEALGHLVELEHWGSPGQAVACEPDCNRSAPSRRLIGGWPSQV